EEFLVATDARRKEVYLAHYRQGSRVSGPVVLKPADAASALPVAGEGALLYPEHFPYAIGPTHPGGATLCRVVAEQSVGLLPPEPLYLRRPDTAAPRPPKRVS
ncbi:MAG TPA: tRNA (adenosine(37)-N6)-threonylcarbamoyltransferase complex dimerization subunit type 1 TsaB, partial [Marmoricola sp.]|nr:tRNA (adenosine(37)-N6)-threonylcarbamoyltransferase complex dimerization subunit type 1 TsaB [Marmoricola sp.]HNN48015.1 tRNA (adenosine(37)-N6)-threonylcarbamoyltransferase complex dimerization subunit type 1 TsaB [Marmoricola sp.]